MQAIAISDLRDVEGFAPEVTDRVWNAWWRAQGVPRAHIAQLVDEAMAPAGIPFTLVAHERQTFLGTASVIESDMDARPHYAPWVAAVWVEPHARNRRVGLALVEAAAGAAFLLGVERVYLCCEPANSAFYERAGWQRIESEVDGLDIFAMTPERLRAHRARSATTASSTIMPDGVARNRELPIGATSPSS